MPMTHMQLAMLVDPGNATATQGTLSAVLQTTQLVAYLQQIAGSISTSLCSGSAFQSIAQQIEQASDILHDGTNQAGRAVRRDLARRRLRRLGGAARRRRDAAGAPQSVPVTGAGC